MGGRYGQEYQMSLSCLLTYDTIKLSDVDYLESSDAA